MDARLDCEETLAELIVVTSYVEKLAVRLDTEPAHRTSRVHLMPEYLAVVMRIVCLYHRLHMRPRVLHSCTEAVRHIDNVLFLLSEKLVEIG